MSYTGTFDNLVGAQYANAGTTAQYPVVPLTTPSVLITSDTSDILDRGLYRKRLEMLKYEENIAAQILRRRRYNQETKHAKKKQRFEQLVMKIAPEFRRKRNKRIKALLLLATMEDL